MTTVRARRLSTDAKLMAACAAGLLAHALLIAVVGDPSVAAVSLLFAGIAITLGIAAEIAHRCLP